MNSQRLLMIVIGINLIIGFALEIYQNPQTENTAVITMETQLMEQYEQEIDSEQGLWGSIKATPSKIAESSIGSPFKWGYTVVKLFLRSMNPFSFTASDFVHPVEKAMASFLMFFRSLLMIICGFEVVLIFLNKKTT